MITLTTAAAGAVTGSWSMTCRVESWRADTLLAEDIPIAAGTEEVDRSLNVPERVTLSVPRFDRGVSWAPGNDPSHPLAPWGQRLRCSIGVDLGANGIEWVQRGWFLITDAQTQDDTVAVTATGLLALIDEARFVVPFQPTGTLVSTVRDLVEPALTVSVDAGLTDRAVPSGMAWDEDRLGGLMELLDAWPADAYVTPDGYLSVVPATDSTSSVLDLTDGTGGTVLRWNTEQTRDGGFSLVVARGQAADGGQVQGIAYATDDATGFTSAFNPLPVPFFYFSPLLTTNSQCTLAARTVLARKQRLAHKTVHFQAVPHPGLQDGDRVTVTSAALGVSAAAGIVEQLVMPYTPDGTMAGVVRLL